MPRPRKNNTRVFWSLGLLCYLEVRPPQRQRPRAPAPRPQTRVGRVCRRVAGSPPTSACPPAPGSPRERGPAGNMPSNNRRFSSLAAAPQVIFWIFCLVSPAVASNSAVAGPDLHYLATEQVSVRRVRIRLGPGLVGAAVRSLLPGICTLVRVSGPVAAPYVLACSPGDSFLSGSRGVQRSTGNADMVLLRLGSRVGFSILFPTTDPRVAPLPHRMVRRVPGRGSFGSPPSGPRAPSERLATAWPPLRASYCRKTPRTRPSPAGFPSNAPQVQE